MRDIAWQVTAKALGLPVTWTEDPVPVRAWIIDSRGRDVEVDGVAVAWTRRGVHVRYFDAHGRERVRLGMGLCCHPQGPHVS